MENDAPGRKKDPLAFAFLAIVTLLLLAGIVLGARALLAQRSSSPPPSTATSASPKGQPPPATDALAALNQRITAGIAEFMLALKSMQSPNTDPPVQPQQQRRANAGAAAPARPPATQQSDPQRAYTAAPAPVASQVVAVPADGKWAYDVFFGPGWQKNGQLRYSTQRQVEQTAKSGPQNKVGSSMSWAPNAGQVSTWNFGIVEADHPSHANTRFPGFFMHAAYLPQTLQAGNRILWEFPWQGGGTGQLRRFDMRVVGWENVKVQAGEFNAVHLDGKLQYVDKDAVKAEVRYALWYSPRAKQVVRVLWLGRAPDESSAEMIAELASFSAP